METRNIQNTEVSVIVAAYNQERYIGRCLRSLLGQTLRHDEYEVIVVNDGSTDLTSYALSQFEDNNNSRIRVLTNEQNRGLPAALNVGIKNARGKYVVRVDSDDYVNSDFLTYLKVYLDFNLESAAVACDYYEINENEEVLARRSCKTNPIACGIMFRLERFLEIGLYDEDFRLHEEREYRIRFEKKYKIDYVSVPLYRYRKHDNNITNNISEMNIYFDRLVVKHGLKKESGSITNQL
jgi:glycosyltransferase involved in cell wall biosynthesis